MRPKVKVWVVFGKRTKFGYGRAQLLALIGELESIHKAVARFGMSYRTAWGYLRELEQAAGFKFLEPGARGGRRGGTRLTKRAKRSAGRWGMGLFPPRQGRTPGASSPESPRLVARAPEDVGADFAQDFLRLLQHSDHPLVRDGAVDELPAPIPNHQPAVLQARQVG